MVGLWPIDIIIIFNVFVCLFVYPSLCLQCCECYDAALRGCKQFLQHEKNDVLQALGSGVRVCGGIRSYGAG